MVQFNVPSNEEEKAENQTVNSPQALLHQYQ